MPHSKDRRQKETAAKKSKAVEALRAKYLLKYLPYSANIPQSSLHDHIGKPGCDAVAKTVVGEVCLGSKGHYGRRRIAAVLLWNKKKVWCIFPFILRLFPTVQFNLYDAPSAHAGKHTDTLLLQTLLLRRHCLYTPTACSNRTALKKYLHLPR